MKIRNKYDGTTIVSDNFEHKQKTFILDHYYFFYEQDGWEEVKGETNSVDKWHDLSKNAMQ